MIDSNIKIENNKIWWKTPGHVSFEEYDINYAHYSALNNTGNGWSFCGNEKIDRVYIGTNTNEFKIYSWDPLNSKNTKLLDTYQDFDFNSPFILFTGHAGGGTSIVVKFLRYLGVHFGDDCGNINIRKPMESSSFRVWWNLLYYPHSIEDLRKSFKSILGSYNYKKNKINAVKVVAEEPSNRALIVGNVIPNLKVVGIVKSASNKTSTTSEGKKFNLKSPESVLLTQLVQVEGNSVFHLNWDKFFTDYQYCNKFLDYIGVEKNFLNQEELNKFNEKIGFDPGYLTKL